MIVSRQNRKIKNIRRLTRCKGDHAVLEGPHLVLEAVSQGLPLDEVLATPAFMERSEARSIERSLPRAPLLVEPALLYELCDSDSPRGILAVATLPRGGCETIPATDHIMTVVAEGIQDPGNVGALARAVEGAGGSALALTSGSAHPNHPRALRASAGSLLRLPVAVDVTLPGLLERLSPPRPEVVALVAHAGEDLYDFETDPEQQLVLVIGAEGAGLSAEMLAATDRTVTIPLAGKVESLNTAVAAAVVLFEIARRRRPAP